MTLTKINPTTTESWKELQSHYGRISQKHVRTLFDSDTDRARKFTAKWDDFLVDYSKNRITEETMSLLLNLADEVKLKEAMEKYFSGRLINETEGRAVLHTALRAKKDAVVHVDGKNVVPEVQAVKEKIKNLSQAVIFGQRKGYMGRTFTDVVNIGIGGSDLGPAMVTEALKFYGNHLKTHFVSNVDGDHVHEVLKVLDRDTTLFIVVSKSFTTQETLSNALTIKKWFLKEAQETDVAKHFIAVSTNLEKIREFGIAEDNIFPMWDWVGGRFSLWSAVGLSIAISIGYGNFEKLLEGAQKMDAHFRESPFPENIPVILGLLTVWYNNFFGAETEAIIPYTQYLNRFSAYLQQGVMESNGKSMDRAGNRVGYQTGTIIWGETGTNSQHAFFQLIHQGTKVVPSDFIGFMESLHGDKDHHNKLMANFFAQTEALMKGKTRAEVENELALQGLSTEAIASLMPFKIFEGNQPTNTILIRKLTPENLGSLIAMYEHKIFVQGIVWNIFSYDQWGVELGKQLAKNILSDIEGQTIGKHDGSTLSLLRFFKH